MPQSRSASAVTPPTAAILSPANARASRPNSSNFSRTARTAFTRREPDPLVAAGDQALDRLLHLVRGPRRLDRDRRHHLGDGAVLARAWRPSRRPAAWSAAPAPASRTAASSRTTTALSRSPAASPTTAISGRSSPARRQRRRHLAERARHRALAHGRAPRRQHHRRPARRARPPAAPRPRRRMSSSAPSTTTVVVLRRRAPVQSTSTPCGWIDVQPGDVPAGVSGTPA